MARTEIPKAYPPPHSRCLYIPKKDSFCRMTFHDRPALPRGFRCASRHCGLKPKAKDLALFVSDVEATAAAVFTRNWFPGAPVILGRETIKSGRLRAIVANSKVSNV